MKSNKFPVSLDEAAQRFPEYGPGTVCTYYNASGWEPKDDAIAREAAQNPEFAQVKGWNLAGSLRPASVWASVALLGGSVSPGAMLYWELSRQAAACFEAFRWHLLRYIAAEPAEAAGVGLYSALSPHRDEVAHALGYLGRSVAPWGGPQPVDLYVPAGPPQAALVLTHGGSGDRQRR